MPEMQAEQTAYRFGDFELLPVERILTNRGARVALTPRMFDLLVVLVEADGRLLSKETLLNSVWADAAVEEGNLNRTISALRKALGEKKNDLKYIETVPKAGYRFVAAVERTGGRRTPVRADEPQSLTEKPRSEPLPRKRSARYWKTIAGASALILLGALTLSYLVYSRNRDRQVTVDESPKIVRLTNNGFDEDSAAFTSDDRIRFLRFTAVNQVESMIMNGDGSEQRREAAPIRDFRVGTWSPDGRRVLYSKQGENVRTSFVANADGTNEQRLPFTIGPFDWSPDGKAIVYSNNFPTEADSSEIVIYSLETGQSTNISNHPSFDANPSFSPDGRQVIFNSARDGNSEIYLVNVDGQGLRRLTNDPAKEAFQAFSPDGTQIVFNSNRENEKVGIYLLNVNDESPPAKISDTRHNAEMRPGCWSRDGTKIVFMSDAGGDKFNVYSMAVEPSMPALLYSDEAGEIQSADVSKDGEQLVVAVKLRDGTGELRLMDSSTRQIEKILQADNVDLMPKWSPDAKRIIFAMKSGGNTEIFSTAPDGSELTNLTQNEAKDGAPQWSPDGTQIVFSSDRDTRSERSLIFMMNADGSGVRRFTGQHAYEMTPSWSPDGKSIALACDDGTSEALDIVIADVNSGDERVVTRRRFHDVNPSFSPDGRRIVFASQSDGNFEIYVANADGAGLLRLTRNSGDDIMPVFSADGTKIFFVSNRQGRFALYRMSLG